MGRIAHAGPCAPIETTIVTSITTSPSLPSMLDPHLAAIENWLAVEPDITALAIVGRLGERAPETFGDKQHLIVRKRCSGPTSRAA